MAGDVNGNTTKGDEWGRLHAAQLELRRALVAQSSAEMRAQLVAELRANRAAIAALERASANGSASSVDVATADTASGESAAESVRGPGPAADGRAAEAVAESANGSAAAADTAEVVSAFDVVDAGADLALGMDSESAFAVIDARADLDAGADDDGGTAVDGGADLDAGADDDGGTAVDAVVVPRGDVEDDADEAVDTVQLRHAVPGLGAEPGDVAAPDGAEPGDDAAEVRPRLAMVLVSALGAVAVVAVALGLAGQGGGEPRADAGTTAESAAGTPGPGDRASAVAAAESDDPSAVAPAADPTVPPPTIRIGVVGPSPTDDMAFTQSMVDSLDRLNLERGGIEVSLEGRISDSASAASAIRRYSESGHELVIVHSSTFWPILLPIAEEFPDVTFAIGTVSRDPMLANVYTYTVAAEEGGYVLGALAAMSSGSNVIGAVGPIELGTSKRYIDGFKAGAEAERPGIAVRVSYTGSFADPVRAAAAADQLVAAGADVITGHGHAMGPAVLAVEDAGARWMGSQVSQTPVSPSSVVASQVYHWEVLVQDMVADIDAGTIEGRAMVADLSNGGVIIDYNPSLRPAEATTDRVDAIIAGIIDGSIDPGG